MLGYNGFRVRFILNFCYYLTSFPSLMFCVLIKLIFRDWEPSDSFVFKKGVVVPRGDIS